jgi:predicted nuclease of predicted toxin-antitoxin system
VNFLLNVNIPRVLGRRLAADGHMCRHAADVGLARAGDEVIVETARLTSEVIITHDLDYGHLLAFSGQAKPSVIIFRLRNTHPDTLYRRLVESWGEMKSPFERGAIVTIEEAALRIRLLPIVRDA